MQKIHNSLINNVVSLYDFNIYVIFQRLEDSNQDMMLLVDEKNFR